MTHSLLSLIFWLQIENWNMWQLIFFRPKEQVLVLLTNYKYCFRNMVLQTRSYVMWKTMTNALKSIVRCDDLRIQDPYEGVCFGHAFSKAYQYASVDYKSQYWFATSGYQSCPIFNSFFGFYSSIWPKEGSHDVGFNVDPKFKDTFVVNNYVRKKATTTTSIYDSELWIPFELYSS